MKELHAIFSEQRSKSIQWRTSPARERKDRLRKLLALLWDNENRIVEATSADFGKPAVETLMTELLLVAHEIQTALRDLDDWMRPRAVPSGLFLPGARSELHRSPRGTSLIISPWNYPWQLSLSPLVAALAAGNTAMLKPSELTPRSSELLKEILEGAFAKEEVHVALGGKEVSEELLAFPFDHIFFTGSTAVGKVVMAAAAKTLASVTLELGGKSPALVHESADLNWAAERLVWGKWVNAGQTCVAPDTLFVQRSVWPALQENLRRHGERFASALTRDLSRIVSPRHLERIRMMSEESAALGWKLAHQIGEIDPASGRWPIQIFECADEPKARDSRLGREEIFGPLLPVILFDRIDEVIGRLNGEDHPLALYLFAECPRTQERVIRETQSGGLVINDVLVHLANSRLPFGGIGPSGLGSYHGEHGFRAFSHEKAVLRQGKFRALARYFQPPYSDSKRKWLSRLIRSGL